MTLLNHLKHTQTQCELSGLNIPFSPGWASSCRKKWQAFERSESPKSVADLQAEWGCRRWVAASWGEWFLLGMLGIPPPHPKLQTKEHHDWPPAGGEFGQSNFFAPRPVSVPGGWGGLSKPPAGPPNGCEVEVGGSPVWCWGGGESNQSSVLFTFYFIFSFPSASQTLRNLIFLKKEIKFLKSHSFVDCFVGSFVPSISGPPIWPMAKGGICLLLFIYLKIFLSRLSPLKSPKAVDTTSKGQY